MTQEDKAEKYNRLLGQGDAIQREISKLQSFNAGVNTTSEEYDNKINKLRSRLLFLEEEMAKLFL